MAPSTSTKASSYVNALKIPLLMLCLFGFALAAYYFFYVTLHRTYLVERNFRFLATLGDEIETLVQGDERVIQSLLEGNRDRDSRLIDWTGDRPQIQPRAVSFIPFLRSAEVTVDWRVPHTFVLQMVEPNTRFVWMRRASVAAKGEKTGFVQVELEDVLGPLLRMELGMRIFDALLIAAPDGRVILQAGDGTLRIAQLDQLIPSVDGKTPELAFQALARSPSIQDVVVSGSAYKLFTQPCCGQMVRDQVPAAADGWVLCGLIAQRTLSTDSYAVSFPVLILLSAVLLIGVLSWPFVKLALLGEGQRVRAHDVVLVAICAVVGVAFLTVGALDFFAYDRRLAAALDDQLQQFAADIELQAHDEIAAASRELDQLQTAVAKLPSGHNPNLSHNNAPWNELLKEYPFFDSFALIDEDGLQKEKLTFGSVGTLFIPVGDREYFTHWTSTRRSMMPFVDSIRSATTGAREAVVSTGSQLKGYRVAALSIPLHALIDPVVVPGFGFAVIDDDGRVLFHSDPQHNLSENFFAESDGNRRLRALVGARHQELVDIQYWGDDHRALVFPMNVGQQWTLITFYDKSLLRTANVEWLILTLVLLALYVGGLVLLCLGIMFVRPRYRAPWLWPDPMRSREYVDLLPPLILLCTAFALGIAILPATQLVLAAWLMPLLGWVLVYYSLHGLKGRLRPIWPVVIALITTAGLIGVSLGAPHRWLKWILAGALLATPVWVEFARRRRVLARSSPLALPVHISHGLVAALCTALTAVLPAAAFFRVGYGVESASLIKYGQLQFALDRIRNGSRTDEANAKHIKALSDENRDEDSESQAQAWDSLESLRSTGSSWGFYQRFFFSSELVDQRACATGHAVTVASVLPETLEELLPFYSESSVHLRELVHDQAADESWSWQRRGRALIFCPPANTVSPFKSIVPGLWRNGPVEVGNLFLLVLLMALIAGVIGWLIHFALHTVFVVDVIEPLWSGASGVFAGTGAPNLFLIASGSAGNFPPRSNYHVVDLAGAPGDRSAVAQWFDDEFGRLQQSPAEQNVLLLHFEHLLQDPAFNEQKLMFLERIMAGLHRTLVIVSSVPPGRLTASIAAPAQPVAAGQKDMMSRWNALLSQFAVVPVDVTPGGPDESAGAGLGYWMNAGWREILWRINALGFAHSAQFLGDERRDVVMDRLWKQVLPYAWSPDKPALTIDQLLVEVGERSEGYYRELWDTCTPAEKLVLGQIAEEGLVNQKTARTVRMLMARGLVRRRPNFVLMNETFRQFVLSASSRAEVTVLEGQVTSLWDTVRWPFMILLIGSLTFFFATQHELFNTALGIVTGVAAALPALMKVASLFGNRQDV